MTVTVDVYEVIRDGTATLIVNDGSVTEIGGGLYRYLLASGSVDAAATGITLGTGAKAPSESAGKVTIWLSGGTVDTTYTVACKILTSDSRTDKRSIDIRITNR